MPDPTTLPVQMPAIRRQVLGDQLQQRLEQLPGLPVITIYRGEVPGEVPLKADKSRRVAPYAVVFDGTGATDIEAGLARCGEQLRWGPQVTVAAGFVEDCVDAVDRVYAWLYGWSPVLSGVAAGQLEPPPGFDPGPPRPDRTVSPLRYFVPLQWRLDLTT